MIQWHLIPLIPLILIASVIETWITAGQDQAPTQPAQQPQERSTPAMSPRPRYHARGTFRALCYCPRCRDARDTCDPMKDWRRRQAHDYDDQDQEPTRTLTTIHPGNPNRTTTRRVSR